MKSTPEAASGPLDGDYLFGPFRLDGAKRVLWREGQLVPLAPKALELLLALVAQRGDVVSKDELLARVWPDTFVEEANLSVNVSALRKALGAQADGRAWVETVPRRGYRFLGRLSSAPAPPAARPALAVLPFRALGVGEEAETLGLALADAVIARLTGRTPLLVRPTSAILAYVGSPQAAQAAARALRVAAVLEGTVQKDRGRMRVTVQCVPAGEGSALAAWAEQLERDFTSVFDLQDAVAERVAAVLERQLRAPAGAPAARRPTLNGPAYQAYLRGRHFWSRFTGPDLQKAYECFGDAAGHDPDYALPHAGLADVQLVLGFTGLVEPSQAWALAEASAREALRRDPGVAEAHVALAYVALFQRWDWEGAEESLREACRLGPDEPTPRQWLALLLMLRGRLAEAERELQAAEERDPLAVALHTLRGFWCALRGDYSGEAEAQRRALELAPHQFLGHWGLGLAEQHLGRARAAVALHRKALELAEGSVFVKGVLARSLALAGQRPAARKLLEEVEAGPGAAAAAYPCATAWLALGQRARALRCLASAAEARNPWLILLGVDPMLDALRGEPALEELRERVCPGVGTRSAAPIAAKRPLARPGRRRASRRG